MPAATTESWAGGCDPGRPYNPAEMTTEEDVAHVARQLADLTYEVKRMAGQIDALRERANSQQERSNVQHGRIEEAARELHDVSDRLQAAATALRESI